MSQEFNDETVERFGTRKPTEESLNVHRQVRARFADLDEFLQTLPDGRAKALARTELEVAAMWANKAAGERSTNPAVLRTQGY